jgi:hypothetical protein
MNDIGDHVHPASLSSLCIRKNHEFAIGDEKVSLAGLEKLFLDFSISFEYHQKLIREKSTS